MVIEKTLPIRCGTEAFFINNKDGSGWKVFHTLREAQLSHAAQIWIWVTYNAAPAVLSDVETVEYNDRSYYAYLTEAIPKVVCDISFNCDFPKAELKCKMKDIWYAVKCDCHNGNWGLNERDEPVFIDFGLNFINSLSDEHIKVLEELTGLQLTGINTWYATVIKGKIC